MFNVGTVQNGSTGNDVLLLQRLLKSNGCRDENKEKLELDGEFGPKTEYACRKYQKKKGLEVDGIAGTNTWTSILLR